MISAQIESNECSKNTTCSIGKKLRLEPQVWGLIWGATAFLSITAFFIILILRGSRQPSVTRIGGNVRRATGRLYNLVRMLSRRRREEQAPPPSFAQVIDDEPPPSYEEAISKQV